jgi:putative membrane protein
MKEPNSKELTVDFLKNISVAKALGVILLISSLAFLFLIWLIYFRETADETAAWVSNLPALNALLNSASTVFIVLGFLAIRKREFVKHMKLMLTAFITSSLFLISYLVYHNFVGHTPFPGEGIIRPIYFFILISHIILSAFVVPLVLTSYYFAFSGKFSTHRKVSKWTLPIWLYVSVTGVVIFFILNAYV